MKMKKKSSDFLPFLSKQANRPISEQAPILKAYFEKGGCKCF
jgi:hypothetical protein